LVQIADLERGDLGAAQPPCNPTERITRWRRPATVSSADASSIFRVWVFAKASVDPSSAIDRWPLDLANPVAPGVVVADETRGADGSSRRQCRIAGPRRHA